MGYTCSTANALASGYIRQGSEAWLAGSSRIFACHFKKTSVADRFRFDRSLTGMNQCFRMSACIYKIAACESCAYDLRWWRMNGLQLALRDEWLTACPRNRFAMNIRHRETLQYLQPTKAALAGFAITSVMFTLSFARQSSHALTRSLIAIG